MVKRLNFNAMFRPVMLHVFGKTLICRTIEVASQFSQSANLDCITIAGMVVLWRTLSNLVAYSHDS